MVRTMPKIKIISLAMSVIVVNQPLNLFAKETVIRTHSYINRVFAGSSSRRNLTAISQTSGPKVKFNWAIAETPPFIQTNRPIKTTASLPTFQDRLRTKMGDGATVGAAIGIIVGTIAGFAFLRPRLALIGDMAAIGTGFFFGCSYGMLLGSLIAAGRVFIAHYAN